MFLLTRGSMRAVRSGKGERGFTLVEMLFATAVMAVMAVVLYQLFVTGATGMDKGTFLSTTQAQLRSGIQYLQERASRASYMTVIKPGSIVRTTVGYEATFAAGTHNAGSNVDLMSWKMCEHGRHGVSGEDKQEKETAVSVKLEGDVITVTEAGSPVKRLIENVEKVELAVPAGFTSTEEKGAIEVKITTTHPNKAKFPQCKGYHMTVLGFQVEVK